MKRFLLSLVLLALSALQVESAVDRQCNYTVGSTTTATGFANCTEEIADLSTKAFAIATSASNTGNAITIVTSPAVTSLTNGQVALFNSPVTITGAATLQLDGTAAASLYQLDGTTALGSGDLVSGARYMVSYRSDTGRWLLMGTPGTGAAPSAVPYLTVGNTSSLATERAITPDGTTITGTDGGANGSYNLAVTTNGIGNSQIRQGAATSIIGRSANSTGNVADIAASADGQFLMRTSSALTFAVPTGTQITNTAAGNIAAVTVQAAINELDTEKQPLDATLTSWAAFNTNGLLTQTAADTFTGRTLTGPAAGITVTNGNGVSGNPTLALANDLSAVEGLASTGLAARTGTDTWAVRTFTGTANEITVTNGDGVAGNPTASLPSAITLTGKTLTGGTFSGPSITTPGAGITFAGSTSGTTVLQATAIAGTTTLTLPAATDTLVGKATTDTLTNKTFDTAGTGNNFSIAGVAVTANTGTGAVVRATSPTLTTPNLGTPSALTLTNATGLPISGITGLGTGVGTFLATPSSANFAAAVTGETGTGGVVFDNSPTLVTPNLGTPSALTLTNATGLPISGITGLGTGVGTALAVATNSNGGMALQSGTPSSGNCVRWAVGGGIEDSGGTCGGGGGGGSPGGSSGQIQYNNAGSFGGFTASGDATINTGTGAVTIANDAVAYAKMQNVAANSVLARAAATSGDVSEVSLSASQLLGRGATGDVAAITLGTNLTMSGTTLNTTGLPTLSGSNFFTGTQTYSSTNTGATAGPDLVLWRDSASPAADDEIGNITFEGNNTTPSTAPYANVTGAIIDTTASSEDGALLLKTRAAGASATRFRVEGENRYGYNNAGANQGVAREEHWIKLSADYVLTSSTTEQKLFNTTTNGRLTLGTGTYFFDAQLYILTMSGTSGNMAFDPIGGGTAVGASFLYHANGLDNGNPANATTHTGTFTITQQTAASMVTAATNVGMATSIRGTFRITTAGTIIPSGTLVTAAAATVKAGSYFRIWKAGEENVNSVGAWD